MIPGSTNKPGYLYHEPAFPEPNFKVLRRNNEQRLSYLLTSLDWHNKRVLDLGCNAGYFSLKLALYGAKVTGIDPDVQALAIAKNQARRYSVENAYFATPDPERRWTKDKDVLIAFSVLPWIFETEKDPLQYIKKLFEIPTAYVEIQYPPDGRASVPGVTDDRSAKKWLKLFYHSVVKLGVSVDHTEGVRRERTVWKCWNKNRIISQNYSSQGHIIILENSVLKNGRPGKHYDAGKEADMLELIEEFNIAPKSMGIDDEDIHAPILEMTRIYGRPLFSSGISLKTLDLELAKLFTALRAAGISHNDIRPDNLIVGPDYQIYLLDFGHATLAGEPRPEGVNPVFGGKDDEESLNKIFETYNLWKQK